MPFPRGLRELTARLTDPVEILDAADLAGRVHRTGCAHVSTVSRGDHATLTGRVRTVLTCGGEDFLGLTAEVFDGTGAVEVCWLGRRTVPGIDTGRFVRVTGRVGLRQGHKIMFNPRYELLEGQPRSTVEESRDRA
ncbi:hypothetical protein [Dietzia sp. B32]|uniref:hypothetical protein n=1 Tax=Dietzia sp. B32 TaxID=2915130 RepID=UPI0021AE24D3|nr:hypothetical protein [Dietzia sp. B32]UVE95368.1 hypothetical protein L8M95_00710 [Dietzia sp. B32]